MTVKDQPETFRPHPRAQALLDAVAEAHWESVDLALDGSLEDLYLTRDEVALVGEAQ